MHTKTEKFITQLRHATHGERRNTAKYPNISKSAGQIRQAPVAMLQQMFKVTSTRFHAAMQTFASLIDSVVHRCC